MVVSMPVIERTHRGIAETRTQPVRYLWPSCTICVHFDGTPCRLPILLRSDGGSGPRCQGFKPLRDCLPV